MAVIGEIIPFITTLISYYYTYKLPGFHIACTKKHFDAISNYIYDLLSSNNSIESKAYAIFSPYAHSLIALGFATGDNKLWEIVISSIFKNKNILHKKTKIHD